MQQTEKSVQRKNIQNFDIITTHNQKELFQNDPDYLEKKRQQLSIPLIQNDQEKQIHKKHPSDFYLFMITVKLFFGISYLSMPNTFKKAGLVGGIILFTIVIVINCITMLQICRVSDNYRGIKNYMELGERVFGQKGRFWVNLAIQVKQQSGCISYLYFVATQLDYIICLSSEQHCYGNRYYMLFVVILAIMMSSIDSYKYLSYLSVPSIILAIIGMSCISYHSFTQFAQGITSQTPLLFFDLHAFLGRIGLAMYIFDGNAVVINVRAQAKDKKHYAVILKNAVIFTLSLFMVFATLCYFIYREDTKPIFTMNLQPISLLIVFIFICVCFNALTSYPIQILVAFQLLEKSKFFSRENQSATIVFLKKLGSRTIIILVTTMICMMIPTFTDFLNIAGSIGSAGVAFIIPQLLYLKEFGPELSKIQKGFCYFVLGFGIIGGTYSIYYSIMKLAVGDYS